MAFRVLLMMMAAKAAEGAGDSVDKGPDGRGAERQKGRRQDPARSEMINCCTYRNKSACVNTHYVPETTRVAMCLEAGW